VCAASTFVGAIYQTKTPGRDRGSLFSEEKYHFLLLLLTFAVGLFAVLAGHL
jgi:hypothetical protein